ncbi:hypothetical protein PENSUB_10864 [Penicillium subrubescens]|uniref:Uncharacterized protein n=1 Tax=Penicillium subrubescens TaxID=1316194 RepID=A0A1Q5T6I9_9EURO|nr:hypothetical protein PENSUB_10864 [Penicillium subrubescens]
MMPLREVWDVFTGLNAVRRDSPSDISEACYNGCNCIAKSSASTSSSASLNWLSSFKQFLNFCQEQDTGGKNNTVIADVSKIVSLLEEKSLVDAQLSSFGFMDSTTISSVTATSMKTTSTTQSPPRTITSSSTSSPIKNGSGPSAQVLAPAITVPTVAAIIGFISCIFFYLRWRRSKQQPVSPPEYEEGKAQLHADEFRPELDGRAINPELADSQRVMAELPARELVGSEMAGHTGTKRSFISEYR